MQKVAMLGLGIMGNGIAHNLLKAGFPLTVYNRTRAKAEPLAALGATIADSRRSHGRRSHRRCNNRRNTRCCGQRARCPRTCQRQIEMSPFKPDRDVPC